MSQTLFAFLGMLLVMLFALNSRQARVHSQREVFSDELEVMASAAAAEVMQLIGSKPFDARIADGTVTRTSSPSLLTPADYFGHGLLFDNCEDIDDFNNMNSLSFFYSTEEDDGFDFTIDADVRYVDSNGHLSAGQTWIKEVTLTVDGPVLESGERSMIRPVVVRRRFSPVWDSP